MEIFKNPQDIPAEIIAELESAFGGPIDFTGYGAIDENTVSRKLSYKAYEDLVEDIKVMDPETFEVSTRPATPDTHHLVTSYVVRMNAPNNVRGVMPVGPVAVEK